MEAAPQSPLPVKKPEQARVPGVILQSPNQAHVQMVGNVAANLGVKPVDITPVTSSTPVTASKELHSIGATIIGQEDSGLTANDISHHIDIAKHKVTGDDNLLKRVIGSFKGRSLFNRREKQLEAEKLAA